MPHDKKQKIKLLVLWDILCRLTDENHALNSDEIIAELAKYRIEESRRVLPLDIALLNEYGYEVLSYKKKYFYYYVVDRHFDTAEIAMLADVVKASKLSSGQKKKLIEKLSQTVGEYHAETLSKHIIRCDVPKRTNTHIIYNIDGIDRAINENKRVSFVYYSLDAQKSKVYRKAGERYVVNPLVMVWNADNYYLLTYNEKHEALTTYRIDRMEDVRVEETEIVCKGEYQDFDAEEYRLQAFSMFNGELKHVELEFEVDLLDEIYDQFGEEVKVTVVSEKTYRVKVSIRISPNFFAWVIGSRGKIRILYPQEVCSQFDDFVQEIKIKY